MTAKEEISITPVVTDIHMNIDQELIVVTDDKLHLCLLRSIKKMEKRKGWIAPFGILITIIVTLVTSSFNDFILGTGTWQAVFILSAIISFLWLIYSIWEARVSIKIEDVVDELKALSKKTFNLFIPNNRKKGEF